MEVCKRLTEFVHSLDNTRPVTAGVNVLLNVYASMGMGVYKDKGDYKPEPLPPKRGYREKKTGSALFFMAAGKRGDKACRGAAESLDILGLNYASSRYDPDARKYPNRMMVGAETMAADLPYNWERVKKYPQLIGDFVWSAWDYLGEACMGWTYESYKGLPLLANQGMIDMTGKGSWQFTDAIDSWNWPGYADTKATIEVYAPGNAVRLLLNGKEIGTKGLKDFKAVFTTRYQPGTLTAEALDAGGRVLSSYSLSGGTGEIRLCAVPEKRTLRWKCWPMAGFL